MLKDFAIDPDALASWENCRAILDRFAMGSGALISEFPRRWQRMVHEAAAERCGDIELKRIVDRLQKINRRLFTSSGRAYPEGERRWIEKAIEAHESQPFGGVICADEAYARPDSDVIFATEVSSTHPLFSGLGQAHIPRNPGEMARAVRLLLVDATHVKFIDTHYRPGTAAGFDEPMRQILEQVRNVANRKIDVELHTEGSDRRPPEDQIEEGFVKVVDRAIANAEVAVVFYEQGILHNRFLLTNKGGVMWGTGLDEQGTSDRKTDSDDLILLNDQMYELHWRKWNPNK